MGFIFRLLYLGIGMTLTAFLLVGILIGFLVFTAVIRIVFRRLFDFHRFKQ
jgi:hypothetical protein